MNKKMKIEDKIINIYADNEADLSDKLPLVIYNSFDDDGKNLWNNCKEINCKRYILVVIQNINWNSEMTPWKAESIYKNEEEYTGQADEYIELLTQKIIPALKDKLQIEAKYFCLAGYSLAGLFSVYAMYKTDIFERIVACSGSFWYNNFLEYIQSSKILKKPEKIYFSLGDKEKYSKNSVLSKVEENTLKLCDEYKKMNIETEFEFNEGGHFKEADLRVAKGIKWILE